MYRLMIVDDEKQTRQGLSQWNGWHDLGVEVVACAENGRKALSLIDQVLPDLILSDVRMPEMDGLELVEQIRQKHFPAKVIFISGYDDTAYLKKAIKLSAVDYLMKPIDLDELHLCVERLIDELEKDENRNQYFSRALEVYEKGNKALHRAIVEHTIYVNNTAEHMRIISKSIDDLPSSGRMVSVFAYHENNVFRNQYALDLLDSVPEMSYSYHPPYKDHVYCGVMDCSERSPDDISNNIVDLFKSKGYFPCIVGISTYFSDFYGIRNALEEVLSVSEEVLYLEPYTTVFYSAGFEKDRSTVKAIEQVRPKYIISMEKKTEFEGWVEKETERLISTKTIDRNGCINYYADILHTIFSALPASYQSDETSELNESEAILELSKMYNLIQMKKHVLKYYTIVYDILHMDSNEYASHSVRMACKYIDEHLAEEITIQQLGIEVHITPTYLCALFKHKTGQTIGTYVRIRRLEYAAKLLRTSNLKLYDIANKAGYPNPSHFSKLFRKQYGCTPSEYRDQT